jgi:RNase P/RNase MRP subunit POP5
MSKQPDMIPKQPLLKPSEDYYRLRREGIGFIADVGSRLWTDYNTHDPGITILEALCFAITDLTYRTGWDIKDILMSEIKPADPKNPYPNQSFFTAREVLTVNPCTTDDFRRLLIDLEGVRNAWLICKQCVCDVTVYAEHDDIGQLVLDYKKPLNTPETKISKIQPQGLYDVLIELEADRELGELNDRKIVKTFARVIPDHPLTLELRFPAWGFLDSVGYEYLSKGAGSEEHIAIKSVKMLRLVKNKYDDIPIIDDEGLRKGWRGIFYISLEITLQITKDNKENELNLTIHNATLRLFGDEAVRSALNVDSLRTYLEDNTDFGFVQTYRKKLAAVRTQVEIAKTALHSHRNLDEDYCSVRVVGIEDVAVCADVEIEPDADIEFVQARIWFEIEQYFNPPVSFYTLQELQSANVPVETIFNGPELENGFLKTEELQAAQLKTVLRTSDIINRLMDIEGLVSVNYLSFTKYDEEGNVVKGSADTDGDTGEIDTNKISASWQLNITEYHQPRFNRNLSKFLFFKNGLPFTPRIDEALDTLTQLRGEVERPKIKHASKEDLPIPTGTFRNPDDYYPIQNSFPLAYGIGPEGLPSHVSAKRRAQAKQMKAYLLVFEQLLGNALAQLAHTADLFSLDTGINRTYFIKQFSKDKFSKNFIEGYGDLVDGLDQTTFETLIESTSEFYQRRNHFLDHIMARFGEQFSEYALLLSNLQGQQIALDRLIDKKIAFLNVYPSLSHDRGKAFNYKDNPCDPNNVPGLKRRINLLLGYPEFVFYWNASSSNERRDNIPLQLKDHNGKVQLELSSPPSLTKALDAFVANLEQKNNPASYKVEYENGQFQTTLKNKYCTPITPTQKILKGQERLKDELKAFQKTAIIQVSQSSTLSIETEKDRFLLKLKASDAIHSGQSKPVGTKNEAEKLKEELLGWSAIERAIVVEHLLLRPKFFGDVLDPIYISENCSLCCDEDAYSFRLTYVMPGWAAPYDENMEMRRFAERTIHQEIPAHLLCKICWVGNEGFDDKPSDSVIDDIVEVLVASRLDLPEDSAAQLRDHASTIFKTLNEVFKDWYADKILVLIKPEDLNTELNKIFSKTKAPKIFDTPISPALWTDIQGKMLTYFQQKALHGWQFDRFEQAWCKWLESNAKIDWVEERLQERVEAILASKLKEGSLANPDKRELCNLAGAIVAEFGWAFYDWMDEEVNAGKVEFDKGKVLKVLKFNHTFTYELSGSLKSRIGNEDATTTIQELLIKHYQNYVEVSYRLKVLLNLLSNLHNIYPPATLHDCDEGNDQNPVRLGSTALGDYPPDRPST